MTEDERNARAKAVKKLTADYRAKRIDVYTYNFKRMLLWLMNHKITELGIMDFIDSIEYLLSDMLDEVEKSGRDGSGLLVMQNGAFTLTDKGRAAAVAMLTEAEAQDGQDDATSQDNAQNHENGKH